MKLFTKSIPETDALLAFEQALKNLPSNVYIETDADEGTVSFWRRTPQGVGDATQVGEIKCKRKVSL